MRKILIFTLICLITFTLSPLSVAAITLGEYEAKLKQYEDEALNNQKAMNNTTAQINQTNKNIDNIKNEMKSLSQEIVKLNEEIANYSVEIKEKTEQSKKLLEYLQFSDKEDLYLEYIVNANSVTDLIYRSAVVQELTEYNNKTINQLKNMIDGNKERENEIDDIEQRLNKKEDELSENLVSLGEKKISLSETAVTVSKQIEIYKELVTSYKKQGCKSNDVIGVDCAVQGEAGIFRRPTQTGYVTSEFGTRGTSFHRGIDVGSRNSRNEKIYPVANGTIIAKYIDDYGALVIAIEHYSSVKGQWYTSLYAHMTSYAPNLYVGKAVTSDQYIGYMGDTGYAFGVHLHLELAPCRMYNWSDPNCSTWNKYDAFIRNQAKNGFKGPRAVITFPNGTGYYNSWNSR